MRDAVAFSAQIQPFKSRGRELGRVDVEGAHALRRARKVFRLRLNGAADTAGWIERTRSERDGPDRRRRRQPRKLTMARPPKVPGRFTLFDLNNESCRWPMGRRGKYLFCGVAEADVLCGIPYCARHMRRAYTDAVSFEKSRRSAFAGDVKSSNIGVSA